ncbi:hypothetical protein [Phaeovulum vinaykumarii]|uniref:Uncharacterized protein n=1 Tax=Phaeovulum vinaykumarii TaxID=407234 RepID=A0A1N7M3C2_9RHOB|nr:hypothetical protein [Phaeovulum vinaykumarii]SIS80543.1 hypothetical protein SAMN05421795_105130 [Phaeovulum vinaykumarii]SOC09152.1 hypothetical protein SAMN05878426_10572 [Phaeovulum vinaykumarii]
MDIQGLLSFDMIAGTFIALVLLREGVLRLRLRAAERRLNRA